MKRFFDNLLIDLIAAALMIGMLATGYTLRFPLPPGSNKELTLWGLTRHQWGDIHFWISLGLIAVILVHFCLHWQWIAISVKRKLHRTKAGSALVSGLTTFLVLAAVLFLFGWAAQSGVNKITEPRERVCPPSEQEGDSKKANLGGAIPETVTADDKKIGFWEDIYPILERSCLSCHGPKRQRGDFRVDRREDFFGKGGSTPLVVPGKSAESPLIAIVSGLRKEMPRADVHQLRAEQVIALRAWIDAGAAWPDRSGQE